MEIMQGIKFGTFYVLIDVFQDYYKEMLEPDKFGDWQNSLYK